MQQLVSDEIVSPTSDVGHVLGIGEVCLFSSQFLCQYLLLCDVNASADESHKKFSRRNWNTHTPYITHLSIWPHNPLREVEFAMVNHYCPNHLFYEFTIF